MMRALLALFLALLTVSSAHASPDEWSRPHAPFRIVGPIHYVGTEGIGVYLIRTSAGLILLDGGPKEAAPIVEANIAALGFKLRDVKIIIASHAHWDHVAALAALKRDSGARLLASAGDRQALATGTPPSDTDYGVVHFPAVPVDGVLTDGKPVRLGDTAITPILTPGHTPGCTTWTMRVVEKGRPLRVIFPCSLTVAGNKLVGNKGYPGIVGDYRASFARLRKVKADVVLTAHPEFADVLGRGQKLAAGEPQAFIAPDLLQKIVTEQQQDFDEELAEQEKAS